MAARASKANQEISQNIQSNCLAFDFSFSISLAERISLILSAHFIPRLAYSANTQTPPPVGASLPRRPYPWPPTLSSMLLLFILHLRGAPRAKAAFKHPVHRPAGRCWCVHFRTDLLRTEKFKYISNIF
jgi:hypothetical protein